MHLKRLSEFKANDQGQVTAVFSRLNVVDHDGDVTLPGAFTSGAKVRISAYNHASWDGALPVGKGVIHEQGDVALLEGQFFMGTTHGKDTFETVKQLGDLGEWSYGYDVKESEQGTHEGMPVRFLKALDVHEVSPVLLGAGIGTHTVAAKNRDRTAGLTDDDVLELADRMASVLKSKGLPVPTTLAELVRQADSAEALEVRTKDSLKAIAAAHGIHLEGGN